MGYRLLNLAYCLPLSSLVDVMVMGYWLWVIGYGLLRLIGQGKCKKYKI